jgi:tRNA-dihydrouridine synthase A
MANPDLVADCVKAMRDAAPRVPITVKHRLGVDRETHYEFARDFVGTIADAGCQVFIVHARNAWLDGLSPKDNRDIPPLRYDDARRLKQDFPALTLIVNGGIAGDEAIGEHLATMDGVMVGRAAYHDPWAMHTWDQRFLAAGSATPTQPPSVSEDSVEKAYVRYMTGQVAQGVPWPSMARHMLGLRQGQAGARRWRQIWSDQSLKNQSPQDVHRQATAALQAAAKAARPSLASTADVTDGDA